VKRLALIAPWLLLAVLSVCSPAQADVFGPIGLASNGFLPAEASHPTLQQALYAHDPVISADARYVAFDGYLGGLAGVWRRDLQTGEVQPVAVGAQVPGSEACEQPACNSELPSISANGQFISFTTTAQLDPVNDTNSSPDVYVRNMAIPEMQPGAYTLVSTVNGKAEGLSYVDAGGLGSVAAGRTAISADGRQVAFVTTAPSNLDACQPGAPAEAACAAGSAEAPALSTPALQVGVRNLATGETRLVSEEYDPATGQPVPGKPVSMQEGSSTYGAVYSSSGAAPAFPFENRAYNLPHSVGASISADGTTVAWMGTVVFRQARMLSGETTAKYAEPLWRRIADGPTAPTRRVTGGSEPETPACIESGLTRLPFGSQTGPCQGPFAVEPGFGVWAGTVGDVVPAMSQDGYTVAFLATAQLVSLGIDFGRSSEGELDDLYVSDMHAGLSRNEALHPLTELVAGSEGSAPIVDFSVSPDGSQVAFATQRIEFALPSPAYVSQPQSVLGMGELFDVDLGNDTLTRVSGGYEGGASEHPHTKVLSGEHAYKLSTDGALSPSFSADGNTLAFASTASNLVYGDGNTPPVTEGIPTGSSDGSDVFLVSRKVFPPQAAETYVSSPPANPAGTPAWTVSVTASSLKNGTVRLYVEVPGSGRLTAGADSAVPAKASRAARRRSSRARRAHASAIVLERQVASTGRSVEGEGSGLFELTLSLGARYRSLASRAGGLSGTAEVSFSAPGHATIHESLDITFLAKAAPSHAKKARSSKGRRARPAKGKR
jgi:hypothetical protein